MCLGYCTSPRVTAATLRPRCHFHAARTHGDPIAASPTFWMIAAHEAALTVRTSEAMPQDHLRTASCIWISRNIGHLQQPVRISASEISTAPVPEASASALLAHY